MHILKKFYFDAQLQLQKLIDPLVLPKNINQAFTAALKLDRVSEFNAVLVQAIAHNKITNVKFQEFLIACIQKEAKVTNHTEAQRESTALSVEIKKLITYLTLAHVPLIVQLNRAAELDGLVPSPTAISPRVDSDFDHEPLEESWVVVPSNESLGCNLETKEEMRASNL